jgi:hypothetical protein
MPEAQGFFDKILIPDKNDLTRKNAIFYFNSGRFSLAYPPLTKRRSKRIKILE